MPSVVRHLRPDDPEFGAIIAGFTHEELASATADAILYGNVVVDADGRWLPWERYGRSMDTQPEDSA